MSMSYICISIFVSTYSKPGGGHGNPLQGSWLENLHGRRSLEGYSPWGRKESDTTERLSTAQTWLLSLQPTYELAQYSRLWNRLFLKPNVFHKALCFLWCDESMRNNDSFLTLVCMVQSSGFLFRWQYWNSHQLLQHFCPREASNALALFPSFYFICMMSSTEWISLKSGIYKQNSYL